MLGSLRRSGFLAVAAALFGMTAAAAPALHSRPRVVRTAANAAKPGRRGLFNDWALPTTASRYGRKGAGITVAQGKRASRKARNVARNRANHR